MNPYRPDLVRTNRCPARIKVQPVKISSLRSSHGAIDALVDQNAAEGANIDEHLGLRRFPSTGDKQPVNVKPGLRLAGCYTLEPNSIPGAAPAAWARLLMILEFSGCTVLPILGRSETK